MLSFPLLVLSNFPVQLYIHLTLSRIQNLQIVAQVRLRYKPFTKLLALPFHSLFVVYSSIVSGSGSV